MQALCGGIMRSGKVGSEDAAQSRCDAGIANHSNGEVALRKRLLLTRFLLTILFALLAVPASIAQEHAPLTLLLGAMDEEVALLDSTLTEPERISIGGLPCVRGKLFGRDVVVAQTGIGKVNAAMAATLLVDHLHPAEVIFTGIAGALSPTLQPGDIVIGRATIQHDLVAIYPDSQVVFAANNPLTGQRNPLYVPADGRLLTLALAVGKETQFDSVATAAGMRAPRCMTGIIATGDAFIASPAKKAAIREKLNADAVEMEGAAVAQVCYELGTPCLVIRSISDLATEEAAREIEQFYQVAAANSAHLVMGLVRQLSF